MLREALNTGQTRVENQSAGLSCRGQQGYSGGERLHSGRPLLPLVTAVLSPLEPFSFLFENSTCASYYVYPLSVCVQMAGTGIS